MQDSEGKTTMHAENTRRDLAPGEISQTGQGRKGIGNYTIRVRGHLNQRCMEWFDGFTLDLQENGDSLLSGALEDQSALHGVLERIRDLNLALLSVTQVDLECRESSSENK